MQFGLGAKVEYLEDSASIIWKRGYFSNYDSAAQKFFVFSGGQSEWSSAGATTQVFDIRLVPV